MPVNPVGGSGRVERRDEACTPMWLADLIGEVDIDPCSNSRSHIRARHRCNLESGGNGLLEGPDGHNDPGTVAFDNDAVAIFGEARTSFVNAPYARGQVIRWVRHWAHTRFIFLLRYDTSTAWFRELMRSTTHLWFPNRRINFDPPPGVTFSSNPYPHALFLRQPSDELLARLRPHGYLVAVDSLPSYPATNARDTSRPSGGRASHTPQAGTRGSRARVRGTRRDNATFVVTGVDRGRGIVTLSTSAGPIAVSGPDAFNFHPAITGTFSVPTGTGTPETRAEPAPAAGDEVGCPNRARAARHRTQDIQ